MNIKKLNEELEKLNLIESLDDDIFDVLTEYADNEGVNVADLIDNDYYDLKNIAEYVSEELGRSVSIKKIKKLIQEEIEALKEIGMWNADEDEDEDEE